MFSSRTRIDQLEIITEQDVEESQRELKKAGPSGLKGFLTQKLNEWRNTPLNIGVTGHAGCGKSTFINTMRGLTAEEQGAAAIGIRETSMECRPYPHPDNAGFTLWDLPGIGAPNFPKETYLQKVEFDKYDFFLILARGRFTENDLWLANEVRASGKLFFLIRTRIDEDLANDKDDHPLAHNEASVLEKVRQDCLSNLQENYHPYKVFLISGKMKYETRWDLPELNKKLVEHISGLKQHAMVFSLRANSKDVIEEKYVKLWKRIYIIAAASAAVATIPTPGLYIVADIALLAKEVNMYMSQLNLNTKSLETLSRVYGIPSQHMSRISTIVQAQNFNGVQSNLQTLLHDMAVNEALEEADKFVPVIGSVVATSVSYSTTLLVLRRILDEIKRASLQVFDMATKLAKTYPD